MSDEKAWQEFAQNMITYCKHHTPCPTPSGDISQSCKYKDYCKHLEVIPICYIVDKLALKLQNK